MNKTKSKAIERRFRTIRRLDEVYQKLNDKHMSCAPKSNTIPVGGGDWMDTFFRMEALRGCMVALRKGKTIKQSIAEGKVVSEISVSIWNSKREYQVHRIKDTAATYLERTVRQCMKMPKRIT